MLPSRLANVGLVAGFLLFARNTRTWVRGGEAPTHFYQFPTAIRHRADHWRECIGENGELRLQVASRIVPVTAHRLSKFADRLRAFGVAVEIAHVSFRSVESFM